MQLRSKLWEQISILKNIIARLKSLRHVRVCVTKRKFAMRKQMRFLLANDAVRAESITQSSKNCETFTSIMKFYSQHGH